MFLILLPLFLSSPFFAHSIVPSAILPAVIKVNEVNDIVTWEPPAEPNGVIQYYNILISRDNGLGGEDLVRVVTEVMETRYDFSTLGLSAGVYVIQVGSLFFCVLVVLLTSPYPPTDPGSHKCRRWRVFTDDCNHD